MLIKDLIHASSSEMITVTPDTFVREAARLLSENRIGLLLVLGDAGELTGVLSERDIVAAMANSYTNVDHILVGELMTRSVVSVTLDDSLVDAVSSMNKYGIRHLAVLDDGKPVGIISIRDVLRAFADEVIKNGGVTDTQINREFVSALAAVAYYGTQIHEFLDESSNISCPTILHAGTHDEHVPLGLLRSIETALAGNPDISIFEYDSGHAFAHTERLDHYSAEASEQAHARTFELFGSLRYRPVRS